MSNSEDTQSCTAIILNYRKADLTARCVKSIINQVDHIVVVDNSADSFESQQCLERVREIAGGTCVDVLISADNLGFACGVQYGIEYQRHNQCVSHWLILNNDAMAVEGMVSRLKKVLDEHGGHGLVAPSSTSAMWYQPWLGLVSRQPLFGSFLYFSGACLLVPDALTRPFLFDPDFFMYGEDVELSWRLKQAGIPLVGVNVGCIHESSSSSRNGSLFYEYYVALGHMILPRKISRNHMERIIMILGRLISLPVRATLRCVRHRSLAPYQGLVRALFRCFPSRF
jgi:N-acetylglucosaminyl-diphospho-decaprenol L-rhamnosyltransferase